MGKRLCVSLGSVEAFHLDVMATHTGRSEASLIRDAIRHYCHHAPWHLGDFAARNDALNVKANRIRSRKRKVVS